MNPISRMIRDAVIVAFVFCFLFANRYIIRPKNTTAIVAWPLGRAFEVSGISAFRGLALPKISFASLIAAPVIRIVRARNIPFFFETFR